MYDKIVKQMVEQNISFEELANQLTVSKQTLTKKMKGMLDFTYEEMMIVARILEIADPGEFFFS